MRHDRAPLRSVTPDDRDALIGEVIRLGTTSELARAPVMRRLLDFLVEQSLAGHGSKLKAYSVAVDGLGRDESFDPLTDSYPRVQAGRLRKILDTHYLRNPSAVEIGLAPVGYAILIGSNVETRGHAHSAPAGRSGLRLASESIAHSEIAIPSAPGASWRRRLSTAVRSAAMARAVAIGLLAVLASGLWMTWAQRSNEQAATEAAFATRPPIVNVRFALAAGDSEAMTIEAWILDALRRSWLAEVRTVADSSASAALPSGRDILDLTIVELPVQGTSGLRTIQFRLSDHDTSALIWTDTVVTGTPLPGRQSPLDIPVATLTGTTGVIARHQLAAIGDARVTGYGCLLRFHQYLRTMEQGMKQIADRCVAESLAIDRSDPKMLAAASGLAFNRSDVSRPLTVAALAEARALARESQTLDSGDSAVQAMLARTAYLSGDCTLGRERADRAIDLWPHAAQHWGLAAFFMFECGDADAVDYASSAMRLQGTTSSVYQTVLVFDALDRGDIEAAVRGTADMNRAETHSALFHGLTNAVVLAASGRAAESRVRWRQFAAAVQVDAGNRQAVYDAYHVSRRHRAIAERYLRR